MQQTYRDINSEINLLSEGGGLQLHRDHDAARAFFLEHVNPNTVFFHNLKEKTDYLVENDLWKRETVETYSFDQFKALFKQAYAYKFRFQSFMGAYKFYNQYALKTEDGTRYYERYEDRVVMCAIDLSGGDYDLARDLVDAIIGGYFQPATPTFLNAGRAQGGERVSCFLLRVEDNMESIGRAINSSLQLSKRGGGVGINLSNLRETSAPIKNIPNTSSGVVPVMKILEDSFSYANQLGQRQGAGAVYLNAHHPDIMRALDTKRENADEKVRIKTLSLGVIIPDVTFELAKKNADMYLFSPYDVERVEGKPFADLSVTEHYHQWVEDDRITKTKINARQFFQTLSELQFESGYPYCLFEDTANADHTMGHAGRVQMSNLCVAPETQLLTDTGYHQIKDLAGQWVNAWNGEEFSRSYVAKTGENQKLLTVDFDYGVSIDATEYHKFYVKTGYGNRKVVEKRTYELRPGDQLEDYELPDGTKHSVSVTYVTDYGRVDDTYCLNEPKLHKVIFNGVRTGQCSEILQLQTPSEYHPDGSYKTLGADISCNLGSLNVKRMLDLDDDAFGDVVDTAVRALDNVARTTEIDSVPSVKAGNDRSKAIGLGQMNLHGALAHHGIEYGSDEALALWDRYMAKVTFHAMLTSTDIARQHGEHEYFDGSEYATGAWFKRKIEPWFEDDKNLALGIGELHAPTLEDWHHLQLEVYKHGMANAYLQAIPPTGSISYINHSTASIHPVVAPIEIRKEGRTGRVYYPAPHMTEDNVHLFRDAYQLGYEKLIDTYAVSTYWVDQGSSCTLFFPDTATTRDVDRARIYAWRKGIKTIYYIRVRQRALEGTGVETAADYCEACQL